MAASEPGFSCFLYKMKKTNSEAVKKDSWVRSHVKHFSTADVRKIRDDRSQCIAVTFRIRGDNYNDFPVWVFIVHFLGGGSAGYGFDSPDTLKRFMHVLLPPKASYKESKVVCPEIEQFLRENFFHLSGVVSTLDFLAKFKPVPPPPTRTPPLTPVDVLALFEATKPENAK